MSYLQQKHCKPCEGGVPALDKSEVQDLLQQVTGWSVDSTGIQYIERLYEFKNYYHTIAFVNLVAWLAHQENHHPDMEVSYNRVKVRFWTHAVNGLSENDFINAAKLNTLVAAG